MRRTAACSAAKVPFCRCATHTRPLDIVWEPAKETVNESSDPRWRRLLRLAHGTASFGPGTRGCHRGQPVAPQYRQRTGDQFAHPDPADERTPACVEGGFGKGHSL